MVASMLEASEAWRAPGQVLQILALPEYRQGDEFMDACCTVSKFELPCLLQFFINQGWSPQHINCRGQTLAHLLADIPCNPQVFQLLNRARVPIDEEDFYGFTPLVYAAARGYRSSCVALLETGANPRCAELFASASELPHEGNDDYYLAYRPPSSISPEFTRSERRAVKANIEKALRSVLQQRMTYPRKNKK